MKFYIQKGEEMFESIIAEIYYDNCGQWEKLYFAGVARNDSGLRADNVTADQGYLQNVTLPEATPRGV